MVFCGVGLLMLMFSIILGVFGVVFFMLICIVILGVFWGCGVVFFTLICIVILGVFVFFGLCCMYIFFFVFMSFRYIFFKVVLCLCFLSSVWWLSVSVWCSCCMRMFKSFVVFLFLWCLCFLYLMMIDLVGDGIVWDVIDGIFILLLFLLLFGMLVNIRFVRNYLFIRFVVFGGVGNSASVSLSLFVMFMFFFVVVLSVLIVWMMVLYLVLFCLKNLCRVCGIEFGVLWNKLNSFKLNSTFGDCAMFVIGVLWGVGGCLNLEFGVVIKFMWFIKLFDWLSGVIVVIFVVWLMFSLKLDSSMVFIGVNFILGEVVYFWCGVLLCCIWLLFCVKFVLGVLFFLLFLIVLKEMFERRFFVGDWFDFGVGNVSSIFGVGKCLVVFFGDFDGVCCCWGDWGVFRVNGVILLYSLILSLCGAIYFIVSSFFASVKEIECFWIVFGWIVSWFFGVFSVFFVGDFGVIVMFFLGVL